MTNHSLRPHQHRHRHHHGLPAERPIRLRGSVLSWPAWKRVLAVLPLCLLLWLGVMWALAENLA
jgi:hypothetical protein